ncbi:hypothetical protein KGF56_002076 [Candida oxycetoniae]|uniref:Tag1-like fifth Ig-like domain-containing protein n=1 Tax=Candida oxycetoniae TaxID=497107 RepID=A0AAI9WYK0_9ASCO|nr:uncharacterized protein KGF56_002076 [Candida oxycetoniae]KAI3405120.2 hypothetical protein KGF56_002076 [Candida oxycetoniae]
MNHRDLENNSPRGHQELQESASSPVSPPLVGDDTTTTTTTTEQVDEHTPLLRSRTEVPYLSLLGRILNPNWFHIILIGAMLLIASVYLTANNLEERAREAVDLQVHNARLLGLTSIGAQVQLEASITTNYDSMKKSNLLQKSMVKLGAVIMGSLSISLPKPVQIQVRLVDVEKSPFVPLGYAHPPPSLPIKVNIRNNVTTHLNITSEFTFEQSRLLEFLKYYYQLDASLINMEVKALQEKVKVQIWDSVYINLANIEISDYITIDKNELKLLENVEILKFGINSIKADVLDLSVDLAIYNDYGLELTLDTIWWDLSFADCNGELIKVGIWESLPFKIQSLERAVLNVTGVIKEVPSRLMDDCSNNVSPINQLVQRYLNEDPIEFYLHFNENNQAMTPTWLFELLKRLPPTRLEIKLPRIHVAYYLWGFPTGSTDLVINEAKETDYPNTFSFKVKNNSTISVKNYTSLSLSSELCKLKVDFSLETKENKLLQAKSQDFIYSTIEQLKEVLKIDINLIDLDIVVTDPIALGKATNEIINDGGDGGGGDGKSITESPDILLNATLGSVALTLSILQNLTISKIDIPLITLPKRFTPLEDIGALLPQLDIEIEEIYLSDASNNEIEFFVELSLFNPTDISIEFPISANQSVILGMFKGGVRIGSLIMKHHISVSKQERTQLMTILKLQYTTYSNKVVLQDFLSSYISSSSQLPNNLTVDIKENSVIGNQGLNSFLQEIEVRNVTVPEVTFNIPEYRSSDFSQFIIDVTIHILTSDIELKVYNPLVNAEIQLEIFQAYAKHCDEVLGYIARREVLIIPPGVITTPRIPIKVYNDAARKVLREAVNANLNIDVVVDLNVAVDVFDVRLVFQGAQLISKIRF